MARLLLIMTYGRSGSTLLQGVLNTFPDCFLSGENYNALFHLFRSYACIRRTRHEFGQVEVAATDPWYGADRLDPKAYAASLLEVFMRDVIRPPDRSQYVGFKEIRLAAQTIGENEFKVFCDFLMNVLPSTYVIGNVRDICSTARSHWYANNPEAEKELATVRKRIEWVCETYPERAHLVDYDVYKNDPSSLKSLADFLELPFPAERVEAVMRKQHSSITQIDQFQETYAGRSSEGPLSSTTRAIPEEANESEETLDFRPSVSDKIPKRPASVCESKVDQNRAN